MSIQGLGKLGLALGFLASSAGLASFSPEASFPRVKEEVEARIERQVAKLIPISKHAHEIASQSIHLSRGKFAPGSASDFLGNATTVVELQGNYYEINCHINAYVFVDTLRKRDPSVQVILEENGQDQMIGEFKVACQRARD